MPGRGVEDRRAGLAQPSAGKALDPERLRMLAAGKLRVLSARAGELPPAGVPGVLLPPIDAHFLSAELGCLPAQGAEILHELALEGILVREGDRWRIPRPERLDGWPAR